MDLLYRRMAAEGATGFGLVLALYDRLSGDVQRAAEAVRRGEIERRCVELNHAYLVLGRLESWVEGDDALATSLNAFYGYVRAKMLEASLKQSAKMLEELVELIAGVRSAWQQRESAAALEPVVAESQEQQAGRMPLSQTA